MRSVVKFSENFCWAWSWLRSNHSSLYSLITEIPLTFRKRNCVKRHSLWKPLYCINKHHLQFYKWHLYVWENNNRAIQCEPDAFFCPRLVLLKSSRSKTLCNYGLLPHFAPSCRRVEHNHDIIIDVTDSHSSPLEVSARRVSCWGLEMKPRTRIDLL